MLCGSLVSGEKNDGDRGVSKNEVEQTTLKDSGRDCRNHFADCGSFSGRSEIDCASGKWNAF